MRTALRQLCVPRTCRCARRRWFQPPHGCRYVSSASPSGKSRRETIVFLDGYVTPPKFDFPHELRRYPKTSPAQMNERVRDATIICAATVALQKDALQHAPNLRLVSCIGTGTDHVDHDFLRQKGIMLCNVPCISSEAVAEHAIALYFALERRILRMHVVAQNGPWEIEQAVRSIASKTPRTCGESIVGVIGYGCVGRRIATIARNLGMKVLVAERKNASLLRSGRTSFDATIRTCTSLFISCPLSADSAKMISWEEFRQLRHDAFIINVARGGVLDQRALEHALQTNSIGGFATDVLDAEWRLPASQDAASCGSSNVVVTPHIAWLSSSSMRRTRETIKANIENFVAGRPCNLVPNGAA